MAETNLIERTISVSGLDGRRWADLAAIVDTGATHCQIPEDVAQAIGAARLTEDEMIELPRGRDVIRALYGIRVRLDEHVVATTAILGQPSSPALLGKVALHQMGLGIDPVENRLIKEVVRLLFVTSWPTL